jgi:AraC family transcriptional regulator
VSNTARGVPLWLDQARRLLHEQSGAGIRMRVIAREVGVHPVHLSRSFRQHFGTTMRHYLRDLRLRSACEEIRRTGHSLSRIALAAGFADQAHFTRVFKQVNGLTPSQFRWSIRYGPSDDSLAHADPASGPLGARNGTLP